MITVLPLDTPGLGDRTYLAHDGEVALSALVGGGLVVAAVSDTCAMGTVLARMPWNLRGARATGSALDQLTVRR